MKFKVYDSSTNKGSEIEFDDLVATITACNVSEDYELEAIKAFAVMVRTELARKTYMYGGNGCELHKGYDICTSPGHCMQCKINDLDIPKKVRDAVAQTKNKIIVFEGKLIKPYYHYRCGGATENSENVIGHRVTYLRRVLCSYCKDIKDNNDENYFDIKELEKLFDTKIVKPDNYYNIIKGMFEDIETDDQGRIKTIKIGNKTLKGTEVMHTLKLNSTRFNYTPVRFLIKTIGEGHGLGLCQCGANKMAAHGKQYFEILNYYYTGIEIEEMQIPDLDKPLMGRRLVIDAGHGGDSCDDGKGASGLREKDVNLDIAIELAGMLEADGAQVIMTRKADVSLPLSDRAIIANESKPDFFLSILQNSFASPGVSGTEIYHFRSDRESEKMARLIINELSSSLGTKNRGVRTAEYYLLREIRASSIIIQLLYITNPQDEEKLMNKEFRINAAKAIYNAIKKYYTE